MMWLRQVYTSDSSLHTASINSIAFAPHELGLKVAAASSDGSASVLSYQKAEGQWDYQKVGELLHVRSAQLRLHPFCMSAIVLYFIPMYAT